MTKQSEEAMDLALLCAVLLVVTLYGLPAMYHAERFAASKEAETLHDKNTGRAKGRYVNDHGDFDETYSKVAAVLVSQVQDSNMPAPRKIRAEEMELKLPLERKDFAFDCGQAMWMLLAGHGSGSRFRIRYRYELDGRGVRVNDYYEVEKAGAGG